MKNFRITKNLAFALSASVLLASCSEDNPTPINPGDGGVLENNATISGDITQNATLAKGNTYFLKGGVHVADGATLTIQEGVTVKSDPIDGSAAYLLIEKDSKIEAIGTANAPIVFTSGKANPDRKSTRLNSSHVRISYAVF